MSFEVHPEALETFGESLGSLARDAQQARAYVLRYEEVVSRSSSLTLSFFYSLGVKRIGEAIKKDIERLQDLSSASGRELHKCADVYRHTDKKVEERVDATYPKG